MKQNSKLQLKDQVVQEYMEAAARLLLAKYKLATGSTVEMVSEVEVEYSTDGDFVEAYASCTDDLDIVVQLFSGHEFYGDTVRMAIVTEDDVVEAWQIKRSDLHLILQQKILVDLID